MQAETPELRPGCPQFLSPRIIGGHYGGWQLKKPTKKEKYKQKTTDPQPSWVNHPSLKKLSGPEIWKITEKLRKAEKLPHWPFDEKRGVLDFDHKSWGPVYSFERTNGLRSFELNPQICEYIKSKLPGNVNPEDVRLFLEAIRLNLEYPAFYYMRILKDSQKRAGGVVKFKEELKGQIRFFKRELRFLEVDPILSKVEVKPIIEKLERTVLALQFIKDMTEKRFPDTFQWAGIDKRLNTQLSKQNFWDDVIFIMYDLISPFLKSKNQTYEVVGNLLNLQFGYPGGETYSSLGSLVKQRLKSLSKKKNYSPPEKDWFWKTQAKLKSFSKK